MDGGHVYELRDGDTSNSCGKSNGFIAAAETIDPGSYYAFRWCVEDNIGEYDCRWDWPEGFSRAVQTPGVDFVAGQVWVEFEAGVADSYAETLIQGRGHNVVAQTLTDPVAFIIDSSGLNSFEIVLDIVEEPLVEFAEPNPIF